MQLGETLKWNGYLEIDLKDCEIDFRKGLQEIHVGKTFNFGKGEGVNPTQNKHRDRGNKQRDRDHCSCRICSFGSDVHRLVHDCTYVAALCCMFYYS